MLAGLTKGPNYFSPDRHPERARERQTYVLTRMQEDGVISASEAQQAQAQAPQLVAYDPTRRDTGFYFADNVVHEAKAVAGIDALAAQAYTVHATVQPTLQRATESALQDGLARYEARTGRARFLGAEANLSDVIQRLEQERNATGSVSRNTAPPPPQGPPEAPTWQLALERTRPPLYDVHWTTAVVVSGPEIKAPDSKVAGKGSKSADKGGPIRVGLRDGRVLPLSVNVDGARRLLKLYDLVFVNVVEGKAGAKAELRARPNVQGAAMVLENKTGRILAMAGGFSYPLSQLNRVTQSRRQPGSTLKPVSYLAALEAGLQPNTLVQDQPITLPPIGNPINAREEDYWSPKNYEGGGSGVLTLRRALENSRNLVTAHLLDGAISSSPEDSLDRVCQIAQEAQLYKDCEHYYPFVLGAQPVRMIDLAAFFAAIANEGSRPAPYAIESIEKDGKTLYQHEAQSALIGRPDPAAFYQLKTMLQGVVERGTAHSIHNLSPYVAGKTGTTENENDAWFVGFTNDVTVAVWVGYDNADGQRRTLGGGETGAKTAIPIFEPIIQAVWSDYVPRALLNPPSAQAKRELVDLPIDLASGERLPRGSGKAFMEHFRMGSDGQVDDTQYRLVSREEADSYREADMLGQDENVPGSYGSPYPPGSSFYERDGRYGQYPPSYQAPPRPPGGLFGLFFGQPPGGNYEGRPRRVDPDYPRASRGLY